jgi:hypothetical protein
LDGKANMSEWDPATKKQLNYIGKLLYNWVTPSDIEVYWDSRKLTGKDLSKGEAEDLIDCFKDGRSQVAIDILKHTLSKKGGKNASNNSK